MLAGIIAFITAALHFIPVIGPFVSGGLTTFMTKFFDSKTEIEVARIGGDRDVAISAMQTRVAGLGVIAGSTLLTWLVIMFAGPLVIFLWKVIAWDIVVGSFYGCVGVTTQMLQCATFSTDPIRGQGAEWATTIIVSIFGSLGGLAIASRLKGSGK